MSFEIWSKKEPQGVASLRLSNGPFGEGSKGGNDSRTD